MKTLSSCLILVAILFVGCSKDEMNKMVADAKKSAGDIKEAAGEAVTKAKSVAKSAGDLTSITDVSGKGSMTLDANTEFGASYIRLIPLDGGTVVLQIKSQKDDERSVYPGFLIQGEVKASSLDALAGKSVGCQIFAMKTGLDDVWSNTNESPINVTVAKGKNGFTAKFGPGSLVNSGTGAKVAASGEFECVEF